MAKDKAPVIKPVVVRERSEIVARRLKNPNAGNAMEIPLKEPRRWQLRIFNADAATNRISYAQQKGWIFAQPADIEGRIDDYGLENRDGRLVLGERGKEVLMKMPRDDFQDIQKAKTAYNLQTTFGTKQIKTAIVEQAAQQEGGDEGADFLSRSLAKLEIQDTLEKIPEAER